MINWKKMTALMTTGILLATAAGCQSKNHNQCQKQGDDLFHLAIPPKFFVGCE